VVPGGGSGEGGADTSSGTVAIINMSMLLEPSL